MAKKVEATEERIDPETGEILEEGRVEVTGSLMNPSGGSHEMSIPEDAEDLLDKYAGAGYSEEPEDGLTPILTILQDNSGEVKRNHDRYIDGAESGMMIIRSLRRLYSGQRGILVQPFGFNHVYVEWEGDVGEGAPVNRFLFNDPPEDLYETADPQNPGKKIRRRKSSGNRMVDTREHLVHILDGENMPFPAVLPMGGSNHACSRLWTNMMRSMMWRGRKLPAFFRLYHLKTIFRRRGSNQTWYGFAIEPASFIRDRELLQLGADAFDRANQTTIEGNLSDLAGSSIDEEEGSPQRGGGNTQSAERII